MLNSAIVDNKKNNVIFDKSWTAVEWKRLWLWQIQITMEIAAFLHSYLMTSDDIALSFY